MTGLRGSGCPFGANHMGPRRYPANHPYRLGKSPTRGPLRPRLCSHKAHSWYQKQGSQFEKCTRQVMPCPMRLQMFPGGPRRCNSREPRLVSDASTRSTRSRHHHYFHHQQQYCQRAETQHDSQLRPNESNLLAQYPSWRRTWTVG